MRKSNKTEREFIFDSQNNILVRQLPRLTEICVGMILRKLWTAKSAMF